MPNTLSRPALFLCLSTAALTVQAADGARSTGMGGANVTAGVSAEGAFSNPALLMRDHRANRTFGFRIGMEAELRDSAALISELEDNQDLADNMETEIDSLVDLALLCDTSNPDLSQVCLNGTDALGQLAGDLDKFLKDADSEPVDARFNMGLSGAWPSARIPFGVSFNVRATATGLADVGDSDLEYTTGLSNALADGVLTLQEITDYAAISLDTGDGTINIEAPDDELTSEVRVTASTRAEIAVSMAHQLTLGGRDIDVGITPRFSRLTATNTTENVSDDNSTDVADEFEENENEKSSFTLDVGAAYALPERAGLTVGGVIRNLIPESIRTKNGYEVESTPQVIVSALYEKPAYVLTADLALNEGTYDNFDTQMLNLGAEWNKNLFSVRTGLHADLSIDEPLAFTVGLGVGVVDLGLRLSESNAELSFQIAH